MGKQKNPCADARKVFCLFPTLAPTDAQIAFQEHSRAPAQNARLPEGHLYQRQASKMCGVMGEEVEAQQSLRGG